VTTAEQPTTVARAPTRRAVRDPGWRATAAAGIALLAGPALVLAGRSSAAAGVAVGLGGAVLAAFALAAAATAFARRHAVLIALVVLGVPALVVVGRVTRGTAAGGIASRLSPANLLDASLGRLLPIALAGVAMVAGFVLIADALRARLGVTGGRARPWDDLHGGARRLVPASATLRAGAGVLLVGWAAVLAIVTLDAYAAGSAAALLFVVLAAGAAAAAVGVPVAIARLTRDQQERSAAAWEDDRRRFAAHLHDSVLQTLALVQRQAHDPVAVSRLARRQEHALRAWMAGEADLSGQTLAGALRDVVDEVDDEHGLTVELSINGDRAIDAQGEALAAATREVLRNCARHAPGAPVVLFAELDASAAAVFVRDEGPGFAFDEVPSERRGLRDAVLSRMAAAGGRATVDSIPGEGTEVALRIGRAWPPAREPR
jgi:signal transduction histidine kinase